MTPSTLLHPLKLDVVGFQEDEHDYHFRVELPEPKCCQSCGTLYNLVKFGKDDQAYRDVPIHDKRSTIWVVRRRYKCNSSGVRAGRGVSVSTPIVFRASPPVPQVEMLCRGPRWPECVLLGVALLTIGVRFRLKQVFP